MVAPAVGDLMPDEDWLQSKSRNFRQQARRRRRHLAGEGMIFHLATTPAEITARLPSFNRLHEARFEYRGGSDVLDEQVVAMLHSATRQLDSPDRYRLWTIEDDYHVISAHLFVAAGGEVSYWLGGFDDEWASEQPSLQALIAAIQHAAEHGDDRLDLGPGAQPYKLRLSDREQQLDWMMLFPRGRRRPLAYAVTLGRPTFAAVRQSAIDALPRSLKDWTKRRLRGRLIYPAASS